jgi:hypothetical protein
VLYYVYSQLTEDLNMKSRNEFLNLHRIGSRNYCISMQLGRKI